MEVELTRTDVSQPLLTYYDSDGSRTELSGATLINWQSKIANLFTDYYDIHAGTRVSMSLPNHWIVPAIVGALGWLNAELVLTNAPSGDISLSIVGPDDLLALPDSPNIVACSLSPLALPFLNPVPAGVDDFFGEVRTQADSYSGARSGRQLPIIEAVGHTYDFNDVGLLERTLGAVGSTQRVLIALTAHADAATPLLVRTLAATCALPAIREASVVVVAQTADNDLSAIARQERVDTTITINND